MSRLLNRAEVKRYLLDRSQMLRPALGMRHVSDESCAKFGEQTSQSGR